MIIQLFQAHGLPADHIQPQSLGFQVSAHIYIYTRYKTPDGKRGQSVYLYVFFFIKKCALPAYQLDLTYIELHYRENKLGEDNTLLDRWQIRQIFSSLDHA